MKLVIHPVCVKTKALYLGNDVMLYYVMASFPFSRRDDMYTAYSAYRAVCFATIARKLLGLLAKDNKGICGRIRFGPVYLRPARTNMLYHFDNMSSADT